MRFAIARVYLPALLLFLLSTSPLVKGDSQRYPDVVEVQITETGNGQYRFDVTLSSPYDSPDRYADAFRVKTADGRTLGVRELLHHHANEQPFTRSLDRVQIGKGIDEVIVEGRDQTHGYGGTVKSVILPGR